MGCTDFDTIFMQLALALAKRSHCVKQQVGAVLTKANRVISTGYNGPPAGTYNCDEKWPQVGCPRSLRGGCLLALHAEQNAILYAVENHIALQGTSLYVTLSPCLACARFIFSAGVRKVFYLTSYAAYKELDTDEGLDFLREFGVDTLQLVV